MSSWTPATPLQDGPIDIHAHFMPEECYEFPSATGLQVISDRPGGLHLGETPMAVTKTQLSDLDALIADMDEHRVAVRVLAIPPYAYPLSGTDLDILYAVKANDALQALTNRHPDRLIPLGVVPVRLVDAAINELRRLHELGFPGIEIAPVVEGAALGDPEFRPILEEAARLDMSVLVHPMQQPRPGFNAHYLQNLVGNPVESATAIASLVLSGAYTSIPRLRISFVHGAGVAPALVGRWDHGWRMRSDVSADTTSRPSEIIRQHLYADCLTHSSEATDLLRRVVAPERLLLGSDYPFDMAYPDPVGTAEKQDLDLGALQRNALAWLGMVD